MGRYDSRLIIQLQYHDDFDHARTIVVTDLERSQHHTRCRDTASTVGIRALLRVRTISMVPALRVVWSHHHTARLIYLVLDLEHCVWVRAERGNHDSGTCSQWRRGSGSLLCKLGRAFLNRDPNKEQVSSGLLGDCWRPEERGKSLSLYTFIPLLGPTVGPIIGGVISQHSTWRWSFWSTSAFDAFPTTSRLPHPLRDTCNYHPTPQREASEESQRQHTHRRIPKSISASSATN